MLHTVAQLASLTILPLLTCAMNTGSIVSAGYRRSYPRCRLLTMPPESALVYLTASKHNVRSSMLHWSNCENGLSKNHPQHEPPHSRRRALEIGLIGACIGIAIVAIRALTEPGSQLEWLAVVFAALVLALLHLVVRRSLRQMPPVPAPRARRRPTRAQQSELFASEVDQRWTGMAETSAATDNPAETRRDA